MTTTTQSLSRNASEILDTYNLIADRPGANVTMLALRSLIDQNDRQMGDAIMELMAAGYNVYAEPEPKLRSLTEDDRLAALRLGGENKNWIAIVK